MGPHLGGAHLNRREFGLTSNLDACSSPQELRPCQASEDLLFDKGDSGTRPNQPRQPPVLRRREAEGIGGWGLVLYRASWRTSMGVSCQCFGGYRMCTGACLGWVSSRRGSWSRGSPVTPAGWMQTAHSSWSMSGELCNMHEADQ